MAELPLDAHRLGGLHSEVYDGPMEVATQPWWINGNLLRMAAVKTMADTIRGDVVVMKSQTRELYMCVDVAWKWGDGSAHVRPVRDGRTDLGKRAMFAANHATECRGLMLRAK